MANAEIEIMRSKLYDYLNSNADYDIIIQISQELDKLIYDFYLNKYFWLSKEKNDN
ncbi:Spo0E like sporulation regulatory protein [Caloramator mitchellensis]|uniref:Spo0E like sporulation regulatory protein n=1 Tax=Caloramator mitchellensis TaxID=908809 RepID=A0A0R3JSW0_CALMK|nr:aspartyl-phosphate phosphatase Spo0E family protein [Caloramator mitchellensis]KRQ86593.1 Spo0E like sporulation regulatory protein [Caloramator mitchellensis]